MKKLMILMVALVAIFFLLSTDNVDDDKKIDVKVDVIVDNNDVSRDADTNIDIDLNDKNISGSVLEINESEPEVTQKEEVTEEQDREVEVECAYIPQSDKDLCHTDSVYQVEPGEEIEEYFKKTAEEIKKDLLIEQGGEFCKTEKITGGYKIFFCNEKGEKLEVITVIDKGTDSDGIKYLEPTSYKYLNF